VADDLLARLQRRAILSCLVMAAIGVAIGGWWTALAVLGGGLLIGISFVSIESAIAVVFERRRAGRALLKIVGRYALLGFLAYVMIARLRLPPLGLIAGASSVVAAAALESLTLLRKKP